MEQRKLSSSKDRSLARDHNSPSSQATSRHELDWAWALDNFLALANCSCERSQFCWDGIRCSCGLFYQDCLRHKDQDPYLKEICLSDSRLPASDKTPSNITEGPSEDPYAQQLDHSSRVLKTEDRSNHQRDGCQKLSFSSSHTQAQQSLALLAWQDQMSQARMLCCSHQQESPWGRCYCPCGLLRWDCPRTLVCKVGCLQRDCEN